MKPRASLALALTLLFGAPYAAFGSGPCATNAQALESDLNHAIRSGEEAQQRILEHARNGSPRVVDDVPLAPKEKPRKALEAIAKKLEEHPQDDLRVKLTPDGAQVAINGEMRTLSTEDALKAIGDEMEHRLSHASSADVGHSPTLPAPPPESAPHAAPGDISRQVLGEYNQPNQVQKWTRALDLGVISGPRADAMRALGFEWTRDASGAMQFTKVPGSVAEVEQRFLDALAQKGIPRDQALLPARVIQKVNPDGTLAYINGDLERPVLDYIPADKPVPSGWTPATCQSCLLDDRNFANAIKNGYYPIGEPGLTIAGGGSAFTHDISHFIGFLEHPEYMKAIRETLPGMVAKQLADPHPYASMWRFRVNHLVEATETVRGMPFIAEDLQHQGFLPKDRPLAQLTVQDTANYLSQDPNRMKAALDYIKNNMYRRWIDMPGGTAGDVPQLVDGFHSGRYNPKNDASFSGLLAEAERASRTPEGPEAVARLELALSRGEMIRPEDYVRQLSKGSPDPGSTLWKTVCGSGIYVRGGNMWAMYCQ